MKNRTWVLGLALGCSLVAGAVQAATKPNPQEQQRRAALAERLVEKWSDHVQETYPISGAGWESEMLPLMLRLPSEQLQRAANAGSFDEMNKLLTQATPAATVVRGTPGRSGANAVLGASDFAPKALGSTTSDLVYVPVAPCRLFDTRLVPAGPILAGTSRDFDVSSAANYTAQGGSATDCGVGSVGPFAAAVINFTVVSPSAIGFMTAHAAGTPRPVAATLTYGAGTSLISNEVIVPISQGAGPAELTVYNNASGHVVGDIVGYFIAPQATAMECTETFVSQVVSGNNPFDIQVPNCPTGYSITGAGCRTPGFNDADWAINGLFRVGPGQMTAFCSGINKTAGNITVEGTARCCRVPGR